LQHRIAERSHDEWILDAQTVSPIAGTAAARRDARKAFVEHCVGGGVRHASGDRVEYRVVCRDRADLAFESARNPDGKLFCLPASDRAPDPVFPAGRKVVSSASPADQHAADLRNGPNGSGGSHFIALDDDVACFGGMGFDRSLRGGVALLTDPAGAPPDLKENACTPAGGGVSCCGIMANPITSPRFFWAKMLTDVDTCNPQVEKQKL